MESFSERMGITIKNFLKYDEINEALSNKIFSLIIQNLNKENLEKQKKFEEFIIVKCFEQTIVQYDKWKNQYKDDCSYMEYLNNEEKYLQKYIYEKYNNLSWYEKYDLIELLIKFFNDNKDKDFADNLVTELNNILEEEKTAYRVIDNKITPITDELELEEVSNASTNDRCKFKIATFHIQDAIDAVSQKPEGDYNKVITSSLLALEVALKESLDIKVNDKISNKELINKFQKKYKVNKFITEPINQFIGIIRNAEYDTLHSSPDNKNSSKETLFKATFMEAKYVLVMSCNFLNYIKSLNT